MNPRVLELADAIRAEGVRRLFGVPGSGLSWQLISALEQRAIPFTGVRHEGAGAIMAGAFGRATRTLGCSITIKGPGLANALPGIVSNSYEQWPALSIAEAFGPATPPTRMHKRLDQRTLLSAAVKAYGTPGTGDEAVRRLAAAARAEVPGPVHLDLFAESAPAELNVYRAPATGAGAPAGAGTSRAALVAVERAQRPVVIVGSLATRADWGKRLRELRVPVFTTTAAKGVVDELAPGGFAAGVYTGDGKELAPESRILPQADVVIALGLRNLEVLSPKKPGAKLVLLDVAGESTAGGFGADHLLAHAGALDFDHVLAALASKSWGGELVAECQREVLQYLTEHEWLPGRALAAVQVTHPAVESLVVDTGSFCTVAEHLWRAKRADAFLASANGRYMGTAIPMSLGAALADPARPRVCAIGDGGMMYAAELKLAVERKLAVLYLLMTDGRYGSIACAPSAPGLDLRAVTMAQPSWYRVVEAMGMPAAQVRSVSELLEAVRLWTRGEGPMFVEAVFDPKPYAAMTARVR